MKKILRFLFITLFGLILIGLVAGNIALVWVATGPRVFNSLTPYIEQALTPSDNRYKVDIHETLLVWDGWKHPIDIRLRRIDILTDQGEVFANFPEISVGLDIPSLLLGKAKPTSMVIKRPVVSLYQHSNGEISFGFKVPEEKTADAPAPDAVTHPVEAAQTQNAPPASALVESVVTWLTEMEKGANKHIKRIAIENGSVSIGNYRSGTFLNGDQLSLNLERVESGIAATYGFVADYGENTTDISGKFLFPFSSPDLKADLLIKQLKLDELADKLAQPGLKALAVPLDINLHLHARKDGYVEKLEIDINAKKGELRHEAFEKPITIHQASLNASLLDNLSRMNIAKLEAALNDSTANFSGDFAWNEGGLGINAKGEMLNTALNDVHLYWPVTKSRESREWVITNIKDGSIDKAELQLAIKPGDLDKEFLPADAVTAAIHYQKATINYLPGHPPLRNAKGVTHLTGISLDGFIESADYLEGTVLKNGHVSIPDLLVDNPRIEIALEADALAKDVAHLLSLPPLEHSQRLNIQPEKVQGTGSARVKLGFDYYAKRDENGNIRDDFGMDYDIDATVKDIALPGFMKKYDIEHGQAGFKVNNQRMDIEGTATVNGVPAANIHLVDRYQPTADAPEGLVMDVSAEKMPATSLKRFGLGGLDFITGEMEVQARIEDKDATTNAKAKANLTAAGITIDALKWSKQAGEKAELTLSYQSDGTHITIPDYHFASDTMEAKGNARIAQDGDNKGLTFIESKPFIQDKNRLELLSYELAQGQEIITARGEFFDYSPFLAPDDDTSNDFSFKNFPAVKLDVDIASVKLGEKREISQLRAKLDCKTICESADISAFTGKTPFRFTLIRDEKNRRVVSASSADAGAVLYAFDVHNGVKGGKLILGGAFDDAVASKPFKGKLEMENYTLEEAPILARVLTLASLTGMADTMQGKGIAFKKLQAPLVLERDVMHFTNAKTYGSALGITADGSLTFPAKQFNLEGTVVPSYTVNTILGDVPILGDILTGGKGEGVFAARYSVKGSAENPDVNVNPLSILTPGFLRGLFDVFDADDSKDTKKAASGAKKP